MNAISAYFAGLIFYGPVLLVQAVLARIAGKKWPRLRWLFLGGAAFPIVLELLAFPSLHLFIRVPDWLAFLMGFWLYASFVSFIVFQVVRGVLSLGWRSHRHDPRRRELIRTAAYAAAAAPAAALLYGCFIERDAFGVTEVTVPVPNLPADLEGYRVLQISDVHRGAFLSQRELVRIVDSARGIPCDLLVHTGDFISYKGDPIEACIDELARVKSGEILGCLGNHEVYAEVQDYATRYAATRGIRILRMSSHQISKGAARLNVVGVDYQPFSQRAHYLQGAEHLVDLGACNLLLSHNPDVFPVAARMGFQLTVSGHTHGGQVRTEILHQDVDVVRFYTRYVHGTYTSPQGSCYVTRGLGTIGIPSRLGSPPEISLLRLSRA